MNPRHCHRNGQKTCYEAEILTKLGYYYSLTTNGRYYINKVTKFKRKTTTKKTRNLLLIIVERRLLPQEDI
jgi:hypothetical protein